MVAFQENQDGAKEHFEIVVKQLLSSDDILAKVRPVL